MAQIRRTYIEVPVPCGAGWNIGQTEVGAGQIRPRPPLAQPEGAASAAAHPIY